MYKYYLFVEGLPIKAKTFGTRKAAEAYMYKICKSNSLQISCTECDKHERMYTVSNEKHINQRHNQIRTDRTDQAMAGAGGSGGKRY